MSRHYRSEPIGVVMTENGAPAGFRWRGRWYVVRAIVAAWVEALPWWSGTFQVEPARVDGTSGQRQVWRVEAAPATGIVGVYDLHRISRGDHQCWGLARVLD